MEVGPWNHQAQTLIAQAVAFGIIPPDEAKRIPLKVAALSQDDRVKLQSALGNCTVDTEEALVWKALAAGHTVDEVAQFQSQIHGRTTAYLERIAKIPSRTMHPGEVDDHASFPNIYAGTCADVVLETLHLMRDPVYAAKVVGNMQAIANEQREYLERAGAVVSRDLEDPGAGGTSPRDYVKFVNEIEKATGGTPYRLVQTSSREDLSKAVDKICEYLDMQIPVPLMLADEKGGHAVLALQHRGNMIEVQSNSEVGWVTKQQFLNDDLDHWAVKGWGNPENGLLCRALTGYMEPHPELMTRIKEFFRPQKQVQASRVFHAAHAYATLAL